MGRKPIFEKPMPAAERMRRMRERRKAEDAAKHPKPDPKVVGVEDIELRKQLDQANDEIRELKRERAKKATAKPTVQTGDIEQVARLTARTAELEARVAKQQAHITELAEQRDAANDAWSRYVRQRKAHIVLPRANEPMIRLMSAGMHPDHTGTDKWFKLFKSIPVTIVDEPKSTKPEPPPLPQSAEEFMAQKATDARKAKHSKGHAQSTTPRRRAVTDKRGR